MHPECIYLRNCKTTVHIREPALVSAICPPPAANHMSARETSPCLNLPPPRAGSDLSIKAADGLRTLSCGVHLFFHLLNITNTGFVVVAGVAS